MSTTDADLLARMRRHRLAGLAEMAGGLAHEINQPLGGIRGFAEGLLIGLEEGWAIPQEEIRTKLARIIAEVDRIDDLVQGMRAFADEQGRLEMMPVDPVAVARAALRLLGARLQAHGVRWRLEEVGTPAWVRANPFALQEALQHLLVNAGDACAARGGGTVVVAIVADDDHAVELRVSDDGCGMDAATLARAGEPFFTTKGPDRGIGLGIANARGLLAACGGRLTLESRAGHGTTATIRLPRCAEGA